MEVTAQVVAVGPKPVQAGHDETLQATITSNRDIPNATVVFDIYDPQGHVVGHITVHGVHLHRGRNTLKTTWKVPPGQVQGAYRVKVRVLDPAGHTLGTDEAQTPPHKFPVVAPVTETPIPMTDTPAPTATQVLPTETSPPATDTAVPTQTAAPTGTPVPTDTPLPPSATVVPTEQMPATNTPTAAPTATVPLPTVLPNTGRPPRPSGPIGNLIWWLSLLGLLSGLAAYRYTARRQRRDR
jgi:hypothetical protein